MQKLTSSIRNIFSSDKTKKIDYCVVQDVNNNVTNFNNARKNNNNNNNNNNTESLNFNENHSNDKYANYEEDIGSTPNFNNNSHLNNNLMGNRIIDNSNLFKFTDPSSLTNRSNTIDLSHIDLMHGKK